MLKKWYLQHLKLFCLLPTSSFGIGANQRQQLLLMSSSAIHHGKTAGVQRILYPNKFSYLLKTPSWKQTWSLLFLRNHANIAHVLF